jgi:hypothetical protein
MHIQVLLNKTQVLLFMQYRVLKPRLHKAITSHTYVLLLLLAYSYLPTQQLIKTPVSVNKKEKKKTSTNIFCSALIDQTENPNSPVADTTQPYLCIIRR